MMLKGRFLKIAQAVVFGSLQIMTAFPSHAAPLPEPIARANQGQRQCYSPDTERKTCQAIATFKAEPSGHVMATATIVVSENPFIVMTGSASVVPRSGELCGTLTEQDIENAAFSNGTEELPPIQAGLMRNIVDALVANVLGHEICAAYIPSGQILLVKPRMDGSPMSVPDVDAIWVRPTDGYEIAQ